MKRPETRQSANVYIDLVKAAQEATNRSTNITLDSVPGGRSRPLVGRNVWRKLRLIWANAWSGISWRNGTRENPAAIVKNHLVEFIGTNACPHYWGPIVRSGHGTRSRQRTCCKSSRIIYRFTGTVISPKHFTRRILNAQSIGLGSVGQAENMFQKDKPCERKNRTIANRPKSKFNFLAIQSGAPV